MPRLRYLKNYEELAENDNNQRSFEAGQSWLSNATIISSLSEAKIKQSITYYYQMAHLLEAELRLRSIKTSPRTDKIGVSRRAQGEPYIQLVREYSGQTPRPRNYTKPTNNKAKGIFRGLNLPSDLQYKLRQKLREELNYVCEAQT